MNELGISLSWLFGLAGLVFVVVATWTAASLVATNRTMRLVDATRAQVAKKFENLRIANEKLKSELELERSKGSTIDQQRALILQLQSQISAANMELDRLRLSSAGIAVSRDGDKEQDHDGFAATRTLQDY